MRSIMNTTTFKNFLLRLSLAMQETTGVLLSVYDSKSKRFPSLPKSNLNIPLLFKYEKMEKSVEEALISAKPILNSNEINCFWIVIPANDTNMKKVYIMGPVLIDTISPEQIVKHFSHKNFSISEACHLAEEYKQIPLVSYQMLLFQFSLFFHFIFEQKPDIAALGLTNTLTNILESPKNDENIYNIQQRVFKNEIKAEKLLREGVRKGDVGILSQILPTIKVAFAKLGPSELRTIKNSMLVTITIITRAAIDGGLPVEVAYPLSDYYVTQIKSANNINIATKIQRQAAIDFTNRVKDSSFKLAYSPTVNRCCEYLLANIHKRLSVTKLAEQEHVHPDTLMRRFKKETGITIGDYSRQQKVREAKSLLQFTDKKIYDIAFLLGYSSQNQFISVFRRSTGMTPRAYRQSIT